MHGERAGVITIVDYGVGNIGALINMFDYLGVDARATGDPLTLLRSDKLILPGVGAFDSAMSTLRTKHLVEPLTEAVLGHRTPVLGVCLGMQLLARGSAEGDQPGLGWIDADVLRIALPQASELKVPHVGWTDVRPTRPSGLFDMAGPSERFYFDHSYYVRCSRPEDVIAVMDYGSELCCALSVDNIAGVQFHPEKSHRFGMRLLRAFALR